MLTLIPSALLLRNRQLRITPSRQFPIQMPTPHRSIQRFRNSKFSPEPTTPRWNGFPRRRLKPITCRSLTLIFLPASRKPRLPFHGPLSEGSTWVISVECHMPAPHTVTLSNSRMPSCREHAARNVDFFPLFFRFRHTLAQRGGIIGAVVGRRAEFSDRQRIRRAGQRRRNKFKIDQIDHIKRRIVTGAFPQRQHCSGRKFPVQQQPRLIEEIACETARLLRNRRIFQQSAVGIGIQPGIPGVKRKFRRRSAVGQHAQRRIDPAALRRIRDAAAHHD